MEVNEGDDYEKCLGINPSNPKHTKGVRGPVTIDIPNMKSLGKLYFVCGVKIHCAKFNQKAEITVDPNCMGGQPWATYHNQPWATYHNLTKLV